MSLRFAPAGWLQRENGGSKENDQRGSRITGEGISKIDGGKSTSRLLHPQSSIVVHPSSILGLQSWICRRARRTPNRRIALASDAGMSGTSIWTTTVAT